MKDIIRKICGVPIVGGWVALLIGLILPLIPFILVSEVTGMSQEVLLMFGGLAIAGWNYFLKKSDTINISACYSCARLDFRHCYCRGIIRLCRNWQSVFLITQPNGGCDND